MQVAKWGNSLGVRLPVALVQELGIADGDEVQLRAAPQHSGNPPSVMVQRQPSKLERLQAMRRHRGAFPTDFRFDRDDANSR